MIKKHKRAAIPLALLATAFLCLAGILIYRYWDYWRVRAELSRLDGVQVASYFNYINHIADALGVDLEPDMAPPEAGS